MKFEKVLLTKNDTCLTYVLKRIGKYKQEKTYSLDLYNEYFDSSLLLDISTLKVGDIIMWSSKEFYEQYPYEILESGIIITHNILRGRHCGVIEEILDNNNILYSDCTRQNSEVGIPQINMKNLVDIKTPDYLLIFKT